MEYLKRPAARRQPDSLGAVRSARVKRFDGVRAFLAHAGDFLAAREAEHNLIFGICTQLESTPEVYPGKPYLAAVSDRGRLVGAAVQTAPWDLVLSESENPVFVDAVVADRLADPPPGVFGPVALARSFAEGWTRATGTPHSIDTNQRIYRLSRVVPPPATPGHMRAGEPADVELVARWFGAFIDEAMHGSSPADAIKSAERWVNRRGRMVQLWIDGGEPVSMTGVGASTPHGMRIGPVYTPPEHRGRGYASSLVAAASQAELDAGRSFLFLFTDLANPTSNHIYQAIGYEPVTDIDRYAFG